MLLLRSPEKRVCSSASRRFSSQCNSLHDEHAVVAGKLLGLKGIRSRRVQKRGTTRHAPRGSTAP
jgi:hypothetical protein